MKAILTIQTEDKTQTVKEVVIVSKHITVQQVSQMASARIPQIRELTERYDDEAFVCRLDSVAELMEMKKKASNKFRNLFRR